MKTREQLVAELDAKIPRQAISTRDAGRGRTLDYLSGYYVIKRMNEVFGQGNWSYSADVQKLHEGTVKDRYDADVHSVHYMARVTLDVKIGEQHVTFFTDYGYGDGTDKVNPGKAHELAIKEAVTDGVKRCAKNLGMSLGLALYDKEQEFVDETENKQERAVPSDTPDRGATPKVDSGSDPGKLVGLIKQTAKVAIAKQVATKESIKETLKTRYGVEKSDDLNVTQATEFLKELENKLNG